MRWLEFPLEATLDREFHITKLIAVYYKNNLFITFEIGLFFDPEFCDALRVIGDHVALGRCVGVYTGTLVTLSELHLVIG